MDWISLLLALAIIALPVLLGNIYVSRKAKRR